MAQRRPIVLVAALLCCSALIVAGCGSDLDTDPATAHTEATAVARETTTTTALETTTEAPTTTTSVLVPAVNRYASLSETEFKARATTIAYRALKRDVLTHLDDIYRFEGYIAPLREHGDSLLTTMSLTDAAGIADSTTRLALVFPNDPTTDQLLASEGVTVWAVVYGTEEIADAGLIPALWVRYWEKGFIPQGNAGTSVTTAKSKAGGTEGLYSQMAAIDRKARAKWDELQSQIDEARKYESTYQSLGFDLGLQMIEDQVKPLQDAQQQVLDDAEAQKAALMDKATAGE